MRAVPKKRAPKEAQAPNSGTQKMQKAVWVAKTFTKSKECQRHIGREIHAHKEDFQGQLGRQVNDTNKQLGRYRQQRKKR